MTGAKIMLGSFIDLFRYYDGNDEDVNNEDHDSEENRIHDRVPGFIKANTWSRA